ncbi:DNA polymerase III subunit gamma/tau [Neisseria shayeganii]|uniref:DNA polymerase III subunit gamma/tau n=1 Tax=Neisseria shayeganii 871 TaxID=1032488 RepID=G4CIH5_9NEIS|nr:DNA polymerase III subunit gamma/tau [Neisseria shayeganii]EGY52369.1 DNA polymerase III, gamma/tau subunit DnaX [Neisseria shayeganii 871]
MAYQVLARKWRPKTFADLVGQEHVVKALQNALDKGRLHHAYLLTGTRGVGKTTIARILAKSLNCAAPQHGEPCGVCQSCLDIDQGRFVDLLEIDAASNTGIDNIREVLENAQYAPTAGKYKVYIIDEVHMLSKSAFNAMLKTLEEPPEHVKFILATTDPHKVPVTVLSRCLQFVLRNMTAQQVSDHLAHVLDSEEIAYEPPALALLGRAAAGSMRDALSLLDQAIAMGSGRVGEADVRQMIGAVDKQYLYQLLQALIVQDGAALIAQAQDMAARAIGFDNALSELALLLQRLALWKTVPAALLHDPEHAALSRLGAHLSREQIQLYYQCAIHGKQDLPLAPDEYAGFVMTLLRMLAFSPLAAESCPADGEIHGTELHQPVFAAPALAAAEATQAPLPPAETVSTVMADTEPEPPLASAEMETAVVPAAVEAEAERLPENDLPPWLHDEDRHIPREFESAPMPTETDKPSLPPVQDSLSAEPSEAPFAEAVPLQAEQADMEADEEPVGDFTALQLPELHSSNWHAIVSILARKIGAAQMPARHMAFVGFDAETGLLQLAVAEAGQAVGGREQIQRIEHRLSEAYGRPVHIRLCDWQEGRHEETPAMRQVRIQAENRHRAQAALEADAAAQDILSLFGARWLPDTLELHENSAPET